MDLLIWLLVSVSIPTFVALTKLRKGESLGDSKLPIVWPIVVAVAFAFYAHSIDPYWTITPFIGAAFIGTAACCGIYLLIDRRIQEKEYAKKEIERREKEIRELRKEIIEMKSNLDSNKSMQNKAVHFLGEKVNHNLFGQGVVIGICEDDNVIYIDFGENIRPYTLDEIDKFLV